MLVVFRTDASILIGTGHVMRCLTLANELTRQGHECWFVCREHQGNLGDLIVNQGHGLTLLPAPLHHSSLEKDIAPHDYAIWLGVPWKEDARQSKDIISSLKPDWLVVDHYGLDAQWETSVSSVVGDIMVIDDLANRPHSCAVLLDQNLGRLSSDYDRLLPSECQRLIGPDFALLRPEFAEMRAKSLERRKRAKLSRILISLGGIDRTNVTGRVLSALAKSALPLSFDLHIVMGGGAPFLKEIRRQAAQLPFKTTVSVNVRNMAELMYQADLSIGSAGSTSWERCCMGLPAITIVLAENQSSIAKALADHSAGLLLNVDRLEAELPELIDRYANNVCVRFSLTQSARQICDGSGSRRVASVLYENFL